MDILQLNNLAERHKNIYTIRKSERDLVLVRNDESGLSNYGYFWENFSDLFKILDIDQQQVEIFLDYGNNENKLRGFLTEKVFLTKDGPCICLAFCQSFPILGNMYVEDFLKNSYVLNLVGQKYFSFEDYLITDVTMNYFRKYVNFYKTYAQTVTGLLLPVFDLSKIIFLNAIDEDNEVLL